MWKALIINEKSYVLKLDFNSERCAVLLSDFCDVWKEEISHTAFIERCKTLNPLFEESSPDYLYEKVTSLIRNCNDSDRLEVKKDAELLIFEINSFLENRRFSYHMNLLLQKAEMFTKEITMPLIHAIYQLEMKHNELCDIIEKKDLEILEHVMNGSEIARKQVITKPFSRKVAFETFSQQLPVDLFSKNQSFLKHLTTTFNYSAIVPKEKQSIKAKSCLKSRRRKRPGDIKLKN